MRAAALGTPHQLTIPAGLPAHATSACLIRFRETQCSAQLTSIPRSRVHWQLPCHFSENLPLHLRPFFIFVAFFVSIGHMILEAEVMRGAVTHGEQR